MAEIQMVQGDTKPDLIGTLTDLLTEDPIDLSDVASIFFQMRKPDDRKYTVNASAVVTDPLLGKVRYSWGSSDLNVPGEYQSQWELHYTDGAIQTTNPPNTIEVRRQ